MIILQFIGTIQLCIYTFFLLPTDKQQTRHRTKLHLKKAKESASWNIGKKRVGVSNDRKHTHIHTKKQTKQKIIESIIACISKFPSILK